MTLLSPQSLYAKVEAAENATQRERKKLQDLSKQVEDIMLRMGVEARVDQHGVLQTPKESIGFERELGRYVKMGRDFEKILNEIKSNELLKGMWDKLVMTMRLTQQ